MTHPQDDSMLSTPTSEMVDDTFDSAPGHNAHIEVQPVDTPSSFPPPPANHLNASQAGELSPPRSQTSTPASAARTNGTAKQKAPQQDGVSDDEGVDMHEVEAGPEAEMVSRPAASERDDKPGSGWKNKKVQEEMQRAWDHVVDREWGEVMRQLGDPLAHKLR